MLNKIRAGIFFVWGLVLILFAKQVFGLQNKVGSCLVKKFKKFKNYPYGKSGNKYGVMVNRIFGVVFWVVSGVLWDKVRNLEEEKPFDIHHAL